MKFKIGDKIKIPVVPITANGITRIEHASALIEAKVLENKFIYISGIYEDIAIVGATPGQKHSEFFLKDLEFYLEEQNYEIY